MYSQAPVILLPEKISVLRDEKNQLIRTDNEEFNIYYKNILYPYSEEYDIIIDCPWGKNFGDRWCLDEFTDDMRSAELRINVYSGFGKLLASAACTVEIFEKSREKQFDLLCIGDSMTMAETYIRHAAEKARNVNTLGTRRIRSVNHEGRGGWTCSAYFERYEDNDWGVSPFLFPAGYGADEYYGDTGFYKKLKDPAYSSSYSYTGFEYSPIKYGMLAFDGGRLCRFTQNGYEPVSDFKGFEFSFSKYMERSGIEKPGAVSLLFGANEFQLCGYSGFESAAEEYIECLGRITRSVKEYDSGISVIICMPICGGGGHAWGKKMGCMGSAKQYDSCIKMANYELLKSFDKRRDEGIYICPMLAVCDTFNGFPKEHARSSIYSENTELRVSDWVHPSDTGYMQMGDALAGVIACIRQNKK